MLIKTLFNKLSARSRPLFVLGVFLLLSFIIMKNPPAIEKAGERPPPSISVAVKSLAPKPYQIILDSYGVVRPRTQTTLFPQVSGQVMEISPNFREGSFFSEGEILVTIDDRDFQAAVIAAEANYIAAERLLFEERAQADIAERDWRRSGNQQPAPDLVLRKPQLKAAEAQLKSAQAALETARLNLQRTQIKAPYAGRVLSKNVDIGQLVSNATALGEIYATDYVEIRLPLKNQDLGFIHLPETYRPEGEVAESSHAGAALPTVRIESNLIGQEYWTGHIVRVESAIDKASQQLHVIAQIEDPYGRENRAKAPLKIGQYVTAKIAGNTLHNALVIPNSSIYQGSFVYVVENDLIKRRPVTIAWQNDHETLIKDGLSAGDQLVITPLGQIISGTRAQISNNELTGNHH